MDIKTIVAANLKALLAYAAAQGSTANGPASQKALAQATRLGRGTIQRALGLSDTDTAVGIDTLEIIASAYDLQGWQLLIPNLDPTNAPIVAITDTEKLLNERLRSVSGELARRLKQDQDQATSARRGAGSHRPREAVGRRQVTGKGQRKKKTPMS